MNAENNQLEKEGIGKLMRLYSIPCIVSLLVGALYNIVDQIFIANASYLRSFGNAANTVVFPLTVIALSLAVMIGDGCCAFVSLSIGKGEEKNAKKSVVCSVVIILLFSTLLTILYLFLSDEMITLFGGRVNEETFALSKEYFFYITLGLPFYMFGQAMNPIIRADVSPKFAMLSILFGALINIILDPIFIFVFRWGMMGAAVATVIGEATTASISLYYLFNMKTIKIKKSDIHFDFTVSKKTLSLGLTSFLSQISLVAAMAAINNMIRKYGELDPIFSNPEYSQIPMVVVGIVMKFLQIIISIVVGMAAGSIPIAGYNIGRGAKERVRRLFTLLLILEGIVGMVALIIAEVFPNALIVIFGSRNESVYYTEFAVKCFRIYLSMLILASINKATFIFLQSMGKVLESTMLSIVREVVFGVGFALLLPRFFGLDGVLYSMPLSDILTAIIAFFLIRKTYIELSESKSKKSLGRIALSQGKATE